jgi:hypothetical protein
MFTHRKQYFGLVSYSFLATECKKASTSSKAGVIIFHSAVCVSHTRLTNCFTPTLLLKPDTDFPFDHTEITNSQNTLTFVSHSYNGIILKIFYDKCNIRQFLHGHYFQTRITASPLPTHPNNNLRPCELVADWNREKQLSTRETAPTPARHFSSRSPIAAAACFVSPAFTLVNGDYRDIRLAVALVSKCSWMYGKKKTINLWRFLNVAPGHGIFHEVNFSCSVISHRS